MRFRPFLPLLVIVIVAAALRLYQLDGIDVRFDEASAPQQALAIAGGSWQPVAYFSGSVANHPPLYLYVLALPYLFTNNFLVVAAYRQLLDVAAVALTWLLARRFFNTRVAHIAALLFAVAPWAVQLSRKLWLITPPLFVVIWLWGVCAVLTKRDARGWFWIGLGLALSIGAHLGAIYLVPVTLIVLLLGWRSLRWRPVLAGLAPLGLLAAVYLGHDAMVAFANTRALLGAGGSATTPQPFAPQMALWLTGGAHLTDLLSSALPLWTAQLPAPFALIDAVQIALVIASIALPALSLLARRVRAAEAPIWIALIAWQVLPVLLQLRSARAPQVHYFMTLWPGAWLLLAIVADRVMTRAHQSFVLSALVLRALLALIVGWQVLTTVRFANFVGRNDTAQGGYGDPIRTALAAADSARTAIRAGQFADVIVVVPRDNPQTDESAAVLDVLLAGAPHRFMPASGAQIWPAAPAQYLFAPGTDAARTALLGGATTTRLVFPTRAPERDYVLAQVAVRPQPLMQAARARWANGTQLLGYSALRAGDRLRATIYLAVERDNSVNQHWFARALAADGAQLGAHDIAGIATSQWRVGDMLAYDFDIALTPGVPVALRIGSYAFPAVAQTMLIDAAGNPIDDGITLPLTNP
jgi:hypothetical protein